MRRSFMLILALFVGTSTSLQAQEPLDGLVKKLDSKDANVRFDALLQIAAHGPKAAPALERLAAFLTKFDEQERVLAVLALGQIGKPAIGPAQKLLGHEDEMVRHAAVWTLGLIGADAKEHTPRLLKMAHTDADVEVRIKAIDALARIAPTDGMLLTNLVSIAQDAKASLGERGAVVEQLRHFGEPAITPLGQALRAHDTYEVAQSSLAHLLEKHKTKSAAALMAPFVLDAYAQAKAQPPQVRLGTQPDRAFVSELCVGEGLSFVIQETGDKLFAPLAKKLHGKNAAERVAAAATLGKMGQSLQTHGYAPDLVERIAKELTPLLKHADYRTRIAVAENLPRTGTSIPGLKDALFDDELTVRFHAATALDGGGFQPLEMLAQRLAKAEGDEKIRVACVIASLRLDSDATDLLWQHLADPKAAVRHGAAYTLGARQNLAIWKPVESRKLVVPVLIESLGSKDAARRRQAATALNVTLTYVDQRFVPALVPALKDEDPETRFLVLGALRHHASAELLPVFEPFLRDPQPLTRKHAIQCFGNSGKAGVPRLIKALADEKDRELRDLIIYNLTRTDEPAALEVLYRLTDDAEDWRHAVQALWRISEKRTFPRMLEIMCKKDETLRQTFADLPKALPDALAAAKAVTPLLERDDLAVNRQAAYTLGKLIAVLWSDCGHWGVPIEKTLAARLPKVKAKLASNDLAVRLDAVAFLAELRMLQRKVGIHRESRRSGDPQRAQELDSLFAQNQRAIEALLNLARRDEDLTVRRAARLAMQAPLPLYSW